MEWTFQSCESLHCTPVTYNIVQQLYASIKEAIPLLTGMQVAFTFLLWAVRLQSSSCYIPRLPSRLCSSCRDTEKCNGWDVSYLYFKRKLKMTSIVPSGGTNL